MYIHKTTFLPISTEYYDKQGKKYKTYTALAVDTVDGRPTITKSEAKNLNTAGSTLMEYSSVQYDVGIPDKRMLELISFPLKATRIGCAEARSASFGD
jgi:hypothetical protein